MVQRLLSVILILALAILLISPQFDSDDALHQRRDVSHLGIIATQMMLAAPVGQPAEMVSQSVESSCVHHGVVSTLRC